MYDSRDSHSSNRFNSCRRVSARQVPASAALDVGLTDAEPLRALVVLGFLALGLGVQGNRVDIAPVTSDFRGLEKSGAYGKVQKQLKILKHTRAQDTNIYIIYTNIYTIYIYRVKRHTRTHVRNQMLGQVNL